MKNVIKAAICLSMFIWCAGAGATLRQPAPDTWKLSDLFSLHGYLRVRGDVFHNFDLNRGPTPSTGQTIFPMPVAGAQDQTLTSYNMRARLEPTININNLVRVRFRIDVLDNLVLGSTPNSLPANAYYPMATGTTGQQAPSAGQNAVQDSIKVKRAWGEVLLPFGILSAGRMGSLINWGKGIWVNSGDGLDADLGDAGDRIAFSTALLGHLWMFAYEFSAIGPVSQPLWIEGESFDMEKRDDVSSIAFALARYDSRASVRRMKRAGRTVFNYGMLLSYRWQELDVPSYYRGGLNNGYTSNQLVSRNFHTFAADVWVKLHFGSFRLELESVFMYGRLGNASMEPGLTIRPAFTSTQAGAIFEFAYEPAEGRWSLALEVGFASGDDAAGFGVRTPPDQLNPTRRGDLDGSQIELPHDTTVNNFRFHPDYRIDLILWRRIIGTVTDAVYIRPKFSYRPLKGLLLEAWCVTSFAVFASSTPGGHNPLGLELDLAVTYKYAGAFVARLVYGVLFPFSGLDNQELGLSAEPAHTLHLLLGFVY